MQYCVAMGNPFDGVTLYGPFETSDEADDWAQDNHIASNWEIVPLHRPVYNVVESDEYPDCGKFVCDDDPDPGVCSLH